MAKQVSEILIKLGLKDVEGLDKLKGAFRELEKSIGPNNAAIERARQSIIDYGRDSRNTEQIIKGQIDALRGLQSQVERGSSTWAQLATDIEQFRQASRRTDREIEVLRQSILNSASTHNQSRDSVQGHIRSLQALSNQASLTGTTLSNLRRDIANLEQQIEVAEQGSRRFRSALGQALAVNPQSILNQWRAYRQVLQDSASSAEDLATAEQRLRSLSGAPRIEQRRAVSAQAEIVGSAEYQRRFGVGGTALTEQLPDTTAALRQELNELNEDLANLVRGGTDYVTVSNRIAEVQRELRRELTGTADAFERLARAQSATERRGQKVAGIQEYYSTQGPLAPGVGGYRDPATGAMIARGARTPDRIRVDEAAYAQPIGPQAFPEAGRRAQRDIESALDEVNRIYENSKVQRAEIQAKYDQIFLDKVEQGLNMESRLVMEASDKQFKRELDKFDEKMDIADRKRRSRLTAGQAVQAAGAAISGGIFGGPEGFLGGVGGAAIGSAIPGLGVVGGSFAGAAIGAQVGIFRQQLGQFTEQAAQISKLRLGLAGVSKDLKEFETSTRAVEAASQALLLPLADTYRYYTQLRASTVELNYSADETRKILEGTASAVLKTGGSLADVDGAMRAVVQILSKGKAAAEEVRGQLGERFPGAVIKFAQANKMSVQELDQAFQAGTVTIDKFITFAKQNYEEGGKYIETLADSTEYAGKRMEKALENLRLAIGRSLKDSGAGFQNFAAEAAENLLWLGQQMAAFATNAEMFLGGGMKTPGGTAKEIAERLIGGGVTVREIDQSIQDYENKIKEANDRLASIKTRNILQTIFDETLGAGTPTQGQTATATAALEKRIALLREALKLANDFTRKGKPGAGGGGEEDTKAAQDRAKAYLQAFDQREEALANARLQREEQIAQIRKNAIEQAFQIERQLGDERQNIERDMQRIQREMDYSAGEVDRLRRLASGEDPRVIDAERRAASISQNATENKLKILEDIQDKELQQSRTIADFQKNTAKQIADANQGYAKQVGEIQRDFAKASAKIIEEGSGRAAKRITAAAQIVSLVLERSNLNQLRTGYGYQPVSEPTGFSGGRPMYQGLSGEEVPTQIRQIDVKLERLLRTLFPSQNTQSSLPVNKATGPGIGQQFLGLLGSERGYEDVAGLMPLPIQRMQQQAARPLRMVWEQIQRATEGVYRTSEKEIQKVFKPNPARNQQVLKRIQRMQEAVLDWNPLEAEWKERDNRTREQKRSKTIPTPASAVKSIVNTLLSPIVDRVNTAETQSARLTPQLGSAEYARIYSANMGSSRDLSFMLTDNEKTIIKKTILDIFSATKTEAFRLPRRFTSAEQKANTLNQLSAYESGVIDSAKDAGNSLRSIISNFPGFYEEVIQEARHAGEAFAEGALRNLGTYRSAPAETEQWLKEQEDRRSKQWSDIFSQPIITPGVESQFEGAMLPGRGFNLSRLTKNFGNIASASPNPLGMLAQAIQGAAPTSQLRQQGAQQQLQNEDTKMLLEQFASLSEITKASRDRSLALKDQNRELQLQADYLNKGIEPSLARELANLQQSYETQKLLVELEAQSLIKKGENVYQVQQQRDLELQNLDTLNRQNQAQATQNAQRAKAIQDAQQLKDAVLNPLQQGLTQSFDLLINGTENWGNSLRQIAATVLQDIARQLIQIYVINQAISAIGKLFPTPGGIGTIPVAAVAANGMAFGQNGIVPFAMGGIVNKPTLFKFANGGVPGTGLMGEAGPEAIIPLKRGPDGKLGVSGGGSTTNVTVNVDVQGTQAQGDDARGQQLGRVIAAAVQTELIKQKRPGGLLA